MRESGKPFEDGNFIIYVNGTYVEDDDKGQSDMILKMLRNGMTAEAIAQCAEVDLKLVRKIEKQHYNIPDLKRK